MQRKRQQDVLNSAKYYTDSDWTNIMGQVHANQGLTADLLGPDVNEETMAKECSKKSKPTEAPKSSVPDKSQQPSAKVPPTATQQPSEFSSQPTVSFAEPRTPFPKYQRKFTRARKKSSTELDLTADDRSFIRVLSDDSDDSNNNDDPPISLACICCLGGAKWKGSSSNNEELPLASSGNDPMDTPYPLSAQLMKKMLKHKLEVEIDGIGNEKKKKLMRPADSFIKIQFAASKPLHEYWAIRARIYELWFQFPVLDADFLVADSTFMKVAFGVGFKMIAVPSSGKKDSKALVTIDGEGVDWTNHSEEDEDYALMAYNNSESDTEVTSCSNKCKESYPNLKNKKLMMPEREQLSDASIEIKAYSQGLKKVEAQLVAHQQGQLWYEQKIKFMKIYLDDKTDVLTYHKKLLAGAQKEKRRFKG
ncbi:hypothetical protein Tco_1466910 [Tanacetum coccineum]